MFVSVELAAVIIFLASSAAGQMSPGGIVDK